MSIVLKSQSSVVVDALRASRNADDTLSKLRENSWENRRSNLVALVEAANWRHGPAALLATFDHHVVAKSPNGALIQVEWSTDSDGNYKLGRSVVHETNTPVADLGQELMETARSAVDHILNEDFDTAQPMIVTIAEALDVGGDLQRRVNNEVTLRSLTRNAWWHHVVGIREDVEARIPAPQIEGDDCVAKSIHEMLSFLKEAAAEASDAIRALAQTDYAKDIETLARDVAEDTERAITALMGADTTKDNESLQLYEAVMSAAPRLLNGIEFLKSLVTEDETLNQAKGQE